MLPLLLDEKNKVMDSEMNKILDNMRQHVRNLQDRVTEASDVLQQSHRVNEKIVVMKEYKDEAGTVNSCFRGKDRSGLVRSLQHENRQILSLQEENRQMKLALEDIQRGMAIIMERHRKAVRNFERSNVILELIERRFDESQKNNIYEKRFYELVDLVDGIFKEMGEQHEQDMQKYAAVCAENHYLRQALVNKGAYVPGISPPDSAKESELSKPPPHASVKQAPVVDIHQKHERHLPQEEEGGPIVNGGYKELANT